MQAKDYTMESAKPAAALAAFQRLSSEYRRYLGMLGKTEATGRGFDAQFRDAERRRNDGEVTPEAQADLHHTPTPGEAEAKAFLEGAQECRDQADNLLANVQIEGRSHRTYQSEFDAEDEGRFDEDEEIPPWVGPIALSEEERARYALRHRQAADYEAKARALCPVPT